MRLTLFAMLLACTALQGCSNFLTRLVPTPHSGPAIHTTVVDGVTGKPIAGAIVMMQWHDITPGVIGGGFETGPGPICEGLVYFVSAITDAEGKATLPAWTQSGQCSKLEVTSPEAGIYKPGYKFIRLQYQALDVFGAGSDEDTLGLDDEVMKLMPMPHHYDGYADAQVDQFLSFDSFIVGGAVPIGGGHCFWDALLPAVSILLQENRRLEGYRKPRVSMQRRLYEDLTGPVTPHLDSPCGDLRQKLRPQMQEASAMQPERVPDPALLGVIVDVPNFTPQSQVAFATTGPSPGISTGASTKDAEALGKTGIIYRVQVDPQNPVYMRLSMQLPPPETYQDSPGMPGFRGDIAPGQESGSRDFDYRCYMPVAAYDYRSKMSHLVGTGSCTWIVAFAVAPSDAPIRSFAAVYDLTTHEWELNPSMLLRLKMNLPEYIEIDGPDTLTVRTDLEQVAPRVWRLGGTVFLMTIKSE